MSLSKLDQLYDEACKYEIHVYNYHFSDTKKASCVRVGDYKTITLDKPAIKSQAEEMVLLAEEVGHYATGSCYRIEAAANFPLAKSNQQWCEERARRWKIEKLLPFEEMKRAILECPFVYELAEFFELQPGLVLEAYSYYTETLGLKFETANEDE